MREYLMTTPRPCPRATDVWKPGECWAVTDPECLDFLQTKRQWAGIKAVVKISARRETASGATVQPRYSISSLDALAGTMLESVRRHWSIENSLHWTLDVTYREDQRRVRKSLPT